MQEKLEPNCLSYLALASLASRHRSASADETAHLAACIGCREQLATEVALAVSAAAEPVPARILAAASRPRTPRRGVAHLWYRGGMAAMAILVVALTARQLLGLPADLRPIRDHVKGAVQVSCAVKGKDGAVRNLDDLQHLAALQTGEILQVHVQSIDRAQVTLTDATDGTVYYDGPLPDSGWIPSGVEVTGGDPLRLLLTVCARDAASRCTSWELR